MQCLATGRCCSLTSSHLSKPDRGFFLFRFWQLKVQPVTFTSVCCCQSSRSQGVMWRRWGGLLFRHQCETHSGGLYVVCGVLVYGLVLNTWAVVCNICEWTLIDTWCWFRLFSESCTRTSLVRVPISSYKLSSLHCVLPVFVHNSYSFIVYKLGSSLWIFVRTDWVIAWE